MQSLLRDVEALRGLRRARPVPIERLDPIRFAAALDGGAIASGAPRDAGMLGLLAPRAAGAPAVGAQRAILHEQVIGFYDEASGKVLLRGGGAGPGGLAMQRMVLAHEVEHALQHQTFGASRLAAIADEDARLARLAVLEGDASLVGAAYLAFDEGVPIGRAVARLVEAARADSPEDFLQRFAHSPLLAGAPPAVRESLVFPYLGGMGFMAELHRAGGFRLVDRVLSRPPSTTEQILHPAKYLAGELAIPVRAPAAPEGLRVVETGRMGELQTRALLSQCLGPAVARAAAAGWGGDAFAVVQASDGAPAVLWSTAWDDEPEAAQFEQALRASAGCWAGGPLPSAVLREGAKVAFVRGLPEPRLAAAASALLALPEAAPPPDPPLGDVRLRPPPAPPSRARGTFRGPYYMNERLGLGAVVPAMFGASIDRPDAELSVVRAGSFATGILAVSDRIAAPRFNERVLSSFAEGLASASRGAIEPVWSGTTTLPVGPATGRMWAVKGTSVRLQVLLVPVCGGAGSYVFAQVWAADDDKRDLDRWLLSFRNTGGVLPPVCGELDPD